MKRLRRISVACFGEALWDILPRGIFLGGAPFNVAYHLSRLGVRALPVSAVGRDFLGDEACRRIAGWQIDTNFITRHRNKPTGTVRANLDANGVANYEISRRVAWDHIEVSGALRRQPAPAAIVFGTLALREKPNRTALTRLFAAWPDALRVLDLNLRAPFDRGAAVALALRHAQLLKLNDEELGRVSRLPVLTRGQIEQAARRFAAEHDIKRVCVTAGSRGAGLLWNEKWWWEKGRSVAVRDTIGAGDAFLAAFLSASLARSETPPDALAHACRLGEFIAAHDGATPPYRCDQHGRPRDVSGD